MKKLVSGFSITGNRKEPYAEESIEGMDQEDPFSGMSDAQTNAMMQEMEGAMQGMDEDNPDPRQKGNLMRRMCELTGEKMDEPMEEVVRKLEEGMNPDELEDRMGDFMGEDEGDSPSIPLPSSSLTNDRLPSSPEDWKISSRESCRKSHVFQKSLKILKPIEPCLRENLRIGS